MKFGTIIGQLLLIAVLSVAPACAQNYMQGRVVVLYGQSNAGNFGLDGVPFPGGYTVVNNFRIFTQAVYNSSNPKGAYCVEACWPKYNPSENGATCYANAPMTFWGIEARLGQLFMQDAPDVIRYVYKSCPPGVGLLQNPSGNDWSPRSNGSANKAWNEFIGTWNTAKALMAPYSKLLVDAVIYVGSENDTRNSAAPANITRDLFNLDDAIRLEFGPLVKHVLVKPPNMAPNGAYTPQLWAAMDALAASRPNVYVVDASDQTWQGSTPGLFGHYCASCTNVIAERIYPFIKLP